MRSVTLSLIALLTLVLLVGCSKQRANNPPAKDNVEQALKQNGLDKINVDEDRDKGLITLKGDVATEDLKNQAEQLAKAAAPQDVISNQIGVRPEGQEGTARKIDSNTDDAIESNFKATIAANHWENQHIHFNAKNGVLTLKGDVDTPAQRQDIQSAAAAVPGVQQVVNELTVKGKKTSAANR